ncbi:MAG: hypothetical protein ABR543_16360 [Gemmatimonadaceae bacterium]
MTPITSTPMASRLRYTALLAVAALLAACDTTRTSLAGPDRDPPVISITIPTTALDSVDVGQPLDVRVSAADNLSLKQIVVVVNGIVKLDTIFTSATPKFDQTLAVPLSGTLSGTVLQIQAFAIDGAGNVAPSAIRSVTAYDPSAPGVSVIAPTGSPNYRARDPITITISASDSSGVGLIGYQIVQIGQTGIVNVWQADSAALSTSPTTISRTWGTTVNDSIPPGTYELRGFARDLTGNGAVSRVSVSISIQDAIGPGLDFLSPPADSNITLGSSLRAVVHITDNVGLARLSIVGISTVGDPNLGVVDTTVRYDTVFAPVNVGGQPRSFPAAVRDTIVTRLMVPRSASDSVTGPLYLIARVTDVAGNDSVVVRRVQVVSGPQVQIIRPGFGAVASPSRSIVVELRAVDRDGVRTLGYNVTGSVTATRTAPTPASPPDTLYFVDTLLVPAGTAAPSTFTITPFATDNLGQPGSGASVVVSVQSLATDTQGPLVYQTIRTRVEADDSVSIRAIDPSGIDRIGFIMTRESDGSFIKRDSVIVGGSFTDVVQNIALNIPAPFVGQKVVITSFAYDSRGNVGYSLPSGGTIPQGTASLARPDTTLVVYGRTFSLPSGGLAGDIAVDTLRQRAYVSNMTFDRLEAWEGSTQIFNSRKVPVGSDPWGMFVDNSGDTLLVANSGGTNISRVFIGSGSFTGVAEVPTRRIKTTNTFVADIESSLDEAGIARIKITIVDYSDRPQFIAQSITSDIYYSTKPTPSAPDGTLRRYAYNGLPQPETQQIWEYAAGGRVGHVVLFNADSIFLQTGLNNSVTDSIFICDRPFGSSGSGNCAGSNDPVVAVNALRSLGADVVAISGLDVRTLGLADTTFVAAGGDRRFIAFGEGATPGAGRVMTVQDPGTRFSPGITVRDLVNNASEEIYGLAVNLNSSNAAAHGQESYFFELAPPYDLRLQGKVNTFDTGAGIAFHPDNNGGYSSLNDPTRTAFVASANGTIEIVDSFHYTNRGTLPVRANLYGPIRVTHRFPSDNPAVVLKVFGLTAEGLIVIDIRASDILNLP